MNNIRVEAIVTDCRAFDDSGAQIGIKLPNETVEAFISSLRGRFPEDEIKVETKIELPMNDGHTIDSSTGEFKRVKRSWFASKLDNYTRSISKRELKFSEYKLFRKFSAALVGTNWLIGITSGILLGKSIIGVISIGACTAILTDLVTFKLRQKLLIIITTRL